MSIYLSIYLSMYISICIHIREEGLCRRVQCHCRDSLLDAPRAVSSQLYAKWKNSTIYTGAAMELDTRLSGKGNSNSDGARLIY